MESSSNLSGNSSNSGFVPGEKFIDPEAIVRLLNLPAGIVVADFGCGTGYFSLPVARQIGEKGIVYALDILTDKLEVVESQAKTQGVANILTKRVNLENKNGSKLDGESIDWVILKDMLFQNNNKNQILEEAKRVLKTGGKVLLIEWKKGDTSIGPDIGLRMSVEDIKDLARKNELGIDREIDAGNFHYGLVLVK
ncbi:MAG TPA: class I SAM-dependent methyltransferase [Patescibacteria group bacterium]